MDARALYATLIAVLSIVSATILGAMGKNELAIMEAGMASSALMFVIGLHSEPKDSVNEMNETNETGDSDA